MTARIIDGKSIAAELRRDLGPRVAALAARGVRPGLAVILVGDDPASRVYVRNKERACEQTGIASRHIALPAQVDEAELLGTISRLNADAAVHGILVQLPLPRHLDPDRVIEAIAPHKDADGFHPMNTGALLAGRPGFLPCTPAGIMVMLERSGIALRGKRAVVVGRSNIVGKPMALLLLQRDATVTICHSKTRDLPGLTREADVLVAALGRVKAIGAAMAGRRQPCRRRRRGRGEGGCGMAHPGAGRRRAYDRCDAARKLCACRGARGRVRRTELTAGQR